MSSVKMEMEASGNYSTSTDATNNGNRSVSPWYYIWMTGNFISETIAIPFGVVNAITVLVVMSKINEGVAKSSRVYYIALAFMDVMILSGYHLLLSYVDEDLRYVTNNRVFVNIEAVEGWCKYTFSCGTLAEQSCNWLYVVLCMERLIVVQYPLKAIGLFSQKWAIKMVVLIVLASVPAQCLAALYMGPSYSPRLDHIYCVVVSDGAIVVYFYVVYCSLTVHAVPVFLTATTSLFLTHKVITVGHRRRNLAFDSMNAARINGLNGAVTVLFMSFAHCVLYLPMAALYVVSGLLSQSNNSDEDDAAVDLNYASWLFFNFSALAHCLNVYIYIFRIPAFRQKLFCRN